MKKRRLVMILAMAIMVFAGAAGCGNKEAGSNSKKEESKEGIYTVEFYDSDGKTVLNTEEVKSGECVTEYQPQKGEKVFVGWFATPQMTHRFDFTTAITEDTRVFGGFVTHAEDTRQFVILGSGTSPVLMESNWGNVIGDAHQMTKEDNSEANCYTMTLDLKEGDEFQFAADTSTGASWQNQRGYGYLDSISKDGTEYFANSGGLGDISSKRSNIKCAVAGNYTFTLTTYPAEDTYETDNGNYTEENKEAFNISPYDVITWTYNGESTASEEDVRTDYYIKGAQITGWEDVYTDETRFTEEDGIYTLEIKLTKGDEFMFTSMVTAGENSSVGTEYIRFTNIAVEDTESQSVVSGTDSANLTANQEGIYTFRYDSSAKVLTVSCQ